jgi:hypothetical protein
MKGGFLEITTSGRKSYLNNGEYENDLRSANPKNTVTEL